VKHVYILRRQLSPLPCGTRSTHTKAADMILLKKHGVLVQHIPRTGGTWIRDAIDACGISYCKCLAACPQHIAIKHGLATHIRKTSKYPHSIIAAFVRHPVAYYESVWKWMTDANMQKTRHRLLHGWHPHGTAVKLYRADFNEWVDVMLDEKSAWYTRLVELYVGPDGGEFCSFVGRTEHLLRDVVNLLSVSGYSSEANTTNLASLQSANVRTLHVEWQEATKQRVIHEEREVASRFYGDNIDKRLFP